MKQLKTIALTVLYSFSVTFFMYCNRGNDVKPHNSPLSLYLKWIKKNTKYLSIMNNDLKKLEVRLAKIEKQLDSCRGTVQEDGWQTQRYAKKMRKWDILAQQKNALRLKIEELKELS